MKKKEEKSDISKPEDRLREILSDCNITEEKSPIPSYGSGDFDFSGIGGDLL